MWFVKFDKTYSRGSSGTEKMKRVRKLILNRKLSSE